MKEFVIDSGVLIKALVSEPYSDVATRMVNGASLIIAPDLIWIEAGNVFYKKFQRGEISAVEISQLLDLMLQSSIDTHGSFNLIQRAATLAMETSRSVYDCMYLALAMREGMKFLTADERFANALRSGKYARHVRFIGD